MKKRKLKINENKVYELIGRVVVALSLYAGMVAFIVWGFMQNTIYQEENDGKFYKFIRMDGRTPNKSNVLRTNTIISYNVSFNHNVIRVVINATRTGQKIDFINNSNQY